MRQLVVLVALLVPLVAASTPLLAWSTTSGLFPASSDIRAGSSLTVSNVMSSQFSKVNAVADTVVYLNEGQLSWEDLSRYGSSVFGDLDTAFSSAKSTLAVPSVTTNTNVVDEVTSNLFGAQDVNVVTLNPSDIEGPISVKLSTTQKNIVIVNLPSASPKSASSLAVVDKYIGKVVSYFSASGTTVFVLSSSSAPVAKPTVVFSAVPNYSLNRRSLVSASSSVKQAFTPGYPIRQITFRRFQRTDTYYLYFTLPLFMGIGVLFIMVFFILLGAYGLMVTQTPEQVADKCLIVPN